MTDSERIDRLEAFVRSECAEGLAIMVSHPSTPGLEQLQFRDVGDVAELVLGDDLTAFKPTLREAIDALP